MSNHESPGLTRRNFLKTTAAAAGATVLAGSVLQGCSSIDTTKDLNPAAEDTFYHSICRGNCQGGCGLKIKVREGKVVQTEANTFPEADSEYQRICIKGLSHPYNIYHPDRIKYPMKRVGERGGGEWEQITWDEAIDTIITTWKKNLEEYGPNSNVAQISGTGNSDAVNWAATYRLVNAMGCPQILTTFDQAFLMWGGYTLGFGASFTANEPIDFKSARTLIFWSSNTAISYIQNGGADVFLDLLRCAIRLWYRCHPVL
jgi:molybdopterin-containing oxidoreductase family molybdopterin binding subunit